MKEKISENPKLNDISFVVSQSAPVFDKENDIEIPGLEKMDFSLSVPYYIDEKVFLARKGCIFGSRDVWYNWPTMTEDISKRLTGSYIKNHVKGLVGFRIDEVTTAIYDRLQPSLKGVQLNAFETKGTLYKIINAE